MKIAGVVILYNPDVEDVLKNIKTYLNSIDLLYVIDNSSVSHEEYFIFSDKISYIANMNNLGVARALNQAATKSIQQGFDYLLTMDQDSFFPTSSIKEYEKVFKKIKDLENPAVIGISPKLLNSNLETLINSDYEKVNWVITSGSIINLNIYNQLGGFNETLFIDCVDYDYCLRAILAGHKVFKCKNIILYHIGGSPKLIMGFHIGLYSSERIYFIARNSLYLWKTYFKGFPKLITKNIIFSLVFCFLPNIIFANNKKKTLAAFFKGFSDCRNIL